MNQRMFGGGLGLLCAAAMIATAGPAVAPSQAERGEGSKRNRGRTSRFTATSEAKIGNSRSASLSKMLRTKAPRRSW